MKRVVQLCRVKTLTHPSHHVKALDVSSSAVVEWIGEGVVELM